MPAFPDLDYSSYSYSVAPAVVRTEYGTRNSRQRFLYQTRDDLVNVSLNLTDAEFATFETFVQDTISGGGDTFTAPYYIGDAEYTIDAYIVDGAYDAQYLQNDFWRVSYQLEIKDRTLTEEENIYNVVQDLTGFENAASIFDALEDMINFNNL